MARGKFDYEAFKRFYKDMSNMQRQFDRWIHNFLLEEGLRALRLVRPLTPVDTGTLRRMWSISRVERTGNSLVVYLVNPMEYASYMEDGFTYHTKNGEGHFEGFHMAEISLIQVRNTMPARFEREFKKWLRTLNWR